MQVYSDSTTRRRKFGAFLTYTVKAVLPNLNKKPLKWPIINEPIFVGLSPDEYDEAGSGVQVMKEVVYSETGGTV